MIRSSVSSQNDVDDLRHFSRKWSPGSWKSFDASEASFDPDEVDGPEEGDIQRNLKREACRLDARLGFGNPFDPDDPHVDADCLDPDHHDLESSPRTTQDRDASTNRHQGLKQRDSLTNHNLSRYAAPGVPALHTRPRSARSSRLRASREALAREIAILLAVHRDWLAACRDDAGPNRPADAGDSSPAPSRRASTAASHAPPREASAPLPLGIDMLAPDADGLNAAAITALVRLAITGLSVRPPSPQPAPFAPRPARPSPAAIESRPVARARDAGVWMVASCARDVEECCAL
jgi:hypothetical protein